MRVACLAAIGLCLSLAAPTVRAAPPVAVDVEDAADHHVSAQGTYRGGLQHSWEARLGSGRSASNITGITAHGLLAAHRVTGLQMHQQSALKAAKSLIKMWDGRWRSRRPYTQDVEFLAAAGFIIDAARWFDLTRNRWSPHAYVDHVMTGRKRIPSVVGWDIGSAIRAAVAVGQLDYARGLLREVLRRRGEWDVTGKGNGQHLSRGSLLWAMAGMKTRGALTREQQRVAAGMARDLMAAQQSSGGWLDGSGKVFCTQTTAYAVLGLARWSQGKQAAARGRTWLQRVALADQKFFQGGRIWATTYKKSGQPENRFNSEIQSEAMMALATR